MGDCFAATNAARNDKKIFYLPIRDSPAYNWMQWINPHRPAFTNYCDGTNVDDEPASYSISAGYCDFDISPY